MLNTVGVNSSMVTILKQIRDTQRHDVSTGYYTPG
jgi:hypothetical protein